MIACEGSGCCRGKAAASKGRGRPRRFKLPEKLETPGQPACPARLCSCCCHCCCLTGARLSCFEGDAADARSACLPCMAVLPPLSPLLLPDRRFTSLLCEQCCCRCCCCCSMTGVPPS